MTKLYTVSTDGELREYTREPIGSGRRPRGDCDILIRDANGHVYSAKSSRYFPTIEEAVKAFEAKQTEYIAQTRERLAREIAALERAQTFAGKFRKRLTVTVIRSNADRAGNVYYILDVDGARVKLGAADNSDGALIDLYGDWSTVQEYVTRKEERLTVREFEKVEKKLDYVGCDRKKIADWIRSHAS